MNEKLKYIIEHPDDFVFYIDDYDRRWIGFREKHNIINLEEDDIYEKEAFYFVRCVDFIEDLLKNNFKIETFSEWV